MIPARPSLLIWILLILQKIIHNQVDAIKCYQCSTEKDGKGVDNCGAYKPFNHSQHIAVDCMGEEANTPGTFCFKSIQQSPRGFIWDGRWRSVIRRCAQVSERGISWSCDWGYHENGVYWEECYCAEDSCNHSPTINDFHRKNYKYFLYISILNLIILYFIQIYISLN